MTCSPGFIVVKLSLNRPSLSDTVLLAEWMLSSTPVRGVFLPFSLYSWTMPGWVVWAERDNARHIDRKMRICFINGDNGGFKTYFVGLRTHGPCVPARSFVHYEFEGGVLCPTNIQPYLCVVRIPLP